QSSQYTIARGRKAMRNARASTAWMIAALGSLGWFEGCDSSESADSASGSDASDARTVVPDATSPQDDARDAAGSEAVDGSVGSDATDAASSKLHDFCVALVRVGCGGPPATVAECEHFLQWVASTCSQVDECITCSGPSPAVTCLEGGNGLVVT